MKTPQAPIENRPPSVAATEIPTVQTKTAERAYKIYEEEGRADGRDLDHWLRAEAEVEEAMTTGR